MLNRISDIEEETIDWQWFATDKLGHIASFTTGACLRLPGRIKDDRSAVEVLDEYFRQRAAATGHAVLQEKTATDLLSGVEMGFGLKGEAALERFTESYSFMASRGVFSFGSDTSGNRRYRLIAVPERPLVVSELPTEIRQALLVEFRRLRFDELDSLSETQTL